MADYLIQDSTLDAIADAINAKTGGSSAMTPAQMVTAIGNISGGGSGGSGMQLLASGSYTNASQTASINIPVNYSGTPYVTLVVKDEQDDGVAEMVAWARLDNSYEPTQLSSALGSLIFYRNKSTTNLNGTSQTSWDMISISSSNIGCTRNNQTYPVEAGTYSWYIWGATS